MKVVINRCFGGMSISNEACKFIEDNTGVKTWPHDYTDFNKRSDSELIKCIETIGKNNASGKYAKLEIITIPDDADYEITNYDGMESVHEYKDCGIINVKGGIGYDWIIRCV